MSEEEEAEPWEAQPGPDLLSFLFQNTCKKNKKMEEKNACNTELHKAKMLKQTKIYQTLKKILLYLNLGFIKRTNFRHFSE